MGGFSFRPTYLYPGALTLVTRTKGHTIRMRASIRLLSTHRYVRRSNHVNSVQSCSVVTVLSALPWHDPQFQVLHVETFGFPSSEVSIYKPPLLPKPATGAVCREGGPETEFATAGTWFILEIERSMSSCATPGLLWKVYERRASH